MLSRILEHKKREIEERKRVFPLERMREEAQRYEMRDFRKAIKRSAGEPIRIIAELKRASPSAGLIRKEFDVQKLAKELDAGGASALSVLTEKRFFQGSLDYLAQVREAVSLPLLRKDFVVDDYQLWETRYFGADAVLLIVAALEKDLLQLKRRAEELKLHALVEVHDERELEQAMEIGVEILGINNRDLRTLQVDVRQTERLLSKIKPEKMVVVSESGIKSKETVKYMAELGVDALLIGEELMRAPSPSEHLKDLLNY